ncbi:NTP transferase domain-containing protein [Rhodothermus sp. AH-315-K08]|nr:NTP transferase domain-containing protein [Rhodothermus sp. AH-315-K08]
MKDIKIKPDATLREAMQAMDDTAENALLVVRADDVFVGTVTDGDIRRAILGGLDLAGTIETVFATAPTFFYEDEFDLAAIRSTLTEKKIDLVPILSRDNRVVDFVTWESAFGDARAKGEDIGAPVVIMAGGRGTRLEPFTKVLPKPLIPVGDQPIVNHVIDEFLRFGTSQFYMIVNYKARILKAYFEELQPSYALSFVEETLQLGTAGGLKLLAGTITETFFLSNCDTVIYADYSDIYRQHHEDGNALTLVASVAHHHMPYGVCQLTTGGDLESLVEKPEYSFLVNSGLYLMNPELIDRIPEGKFYHMTDLIADLLRDGEKVGVYPISEKSWLDVGEWSQYREVVQALERGT